MTNIRKENVPTKQAFLDFFNDTFAKGNPKSTYTTIEFYVRSKMTFADTPVTWELLKQKYAEYIRECVDDKKEERYIKSFENFIKDEDYNSNYGKKLKGSSFLDKWNLGNLPPETTDER